VGFSSPKRVVFFLPAGPAAYIIDKPETPQESNVNGNEPEFMSLDIHAGVTVIVLLLALAAILIFVRGYIHYREAHNMSFFTKRKERNRSAFSIILIGILILGIALMVATFAEPAIYKVYIPSPTATLTPTITLTPSITLTPTPTFVPTATAVPLYTPTPILSIIISSQFTSETTPNPDAIFSALVFAKNLDVNYQPIEASDVFVAPIEVMYASFSYDGMTRNAQWTALWFREGELICMETLPWNGGSGGYGYTECQQDADQWQPGNYSVQIFVGETWKQTGTFRVSGDSGEELQGE
jgi:hypothetical protein